MKKPRRGAGLSRSIHDTCALPTRRGHNHPAASLLAQRRRRIIGCTQPGGPARKNPASERGQVGPSCGPAGEAANPQTQYHSRLHTAHGHRKSPAAQGSERG